MAVGAAIHSAFALMMGKYSARYRRILRPRALVVPVLRLLPLTVRRHCGVGLAVAENSQPLELVVALSDQVVLVEA